MLSMTFLISVGFCDIEKKKKEKKLFSWRKNYFIEFVETRSFLAFTK